MRGVHLTVVAAGLAVSLGAASARAACRINNETKLSFTITSGAVSNQRVGAHTTTAIAAGTITGKSDDGKTIAGSCKDGDALTVKDVKGVPVIKVVPKPSPRK